MAVNNTAVQIDAGRLAAMITGLYASGSGNIHLVLRDDGEWMVGATYGREAPDSPMAAAASYQVGTTAREAIDHLLAETGWNRLTGLT